MRDAIIPALQAVEGVAVDSGNWHVTLVFIGAVVEENIAGLQAAVSDIGPVDIRLCFDRISYWKRPRIASALPVNVPSGLRQLVRSIEHRMPAFGIAPDERTYRPHITVARRARTFADLPLARTIDLQWTGFELIESVATPCGVRYRPLKQQLRRDS